MNKTPSTSSDKSNGSLGKAYKLLYNSAQTLGWMALLLLTIRQLFLTGHEKVYGEVYTLLGWFQTAAILEVVHAAIGLVKSNPVLTGFQVASRVFITWHVFSVPEVQSIYGVTLLLFAWCITEVIRYSYYVCSTIMNPPYFLVWLRYTLFIVLYPLGVTGELSCIYYSLPSVAKTGLFSVTLPNAANMSFDYYTILLVIMFLYIPIFPQLYLHMFAQRRKFIGTITKQE